MAFSNKSDGLDVIHAADINALQNAVTAVTPQQAGGVIVGGAGEVRLPRLDAKVRGLSVTDDGTANSTLLASLATEAAAQGAELWIPEGTFIVANVALPSRLRLAGPGTLARQGTNPILLLLGGVSDILIDGVGFSGSYSTGALAGAQAITLQDASHVAIRNARFANLSAAAIGLENAADVEVAGCTFATIAGSAVRLNQVTGTGRLNQRIRVRGNRMFDCQKSGTAGNAAIQAQGSGTAPQHLWIEDNDIDTCTVAVGLDLGSMAWVIGNYITNGRGEGVAFSGADVLVADNRIIGCASGGVMCFAVAGTQDARIVDNTVRGCFQGVALVCGANGVILTNVLVARNRLAANTTYGIQSYLSGGVSSGYGYSNVTVAFNELLGNTTGPYNFLNGTDGSAVREYGSVTSPDDKSAMSADRVFWNVLRTRGGTADTLSVVEAFTGVNDDGGSVNEASEVRIGGSFNASLPQTKYAGIAARKTATFANNVDLVFYTWTASAIKEAARLSANGQLNAENGLAVTGNVGFYGTSPVAKQTVQAAATDATTTQNLVNDLRAKLIALGLVQ